MRIAAIVLAAVAVQAQRIVPLALPAGASEAAVSPDGKALAYSILGDIRLRPFEGGAETTLVEEDGQMDGIPVNLVWSPDGSKLAFTFTYCHYCADHLVVKSLPNGPQLGLGDSCKTRPAWTPNGKYMIIAAPRGDAEDEQCRIDLVPADGSARTTLVADEGDHVAVSPDGKRLVYAARNVLKLAALTSDFRIFGTPRVIAQEVHSLSSIHWTADGHSVVYQIWDGSYTRRLTIDGAPATQLLDPGTEFTISQLLPDGTALGMQLSEARSLWRIDLHQADRKSEKLRAIPWTEKNVAVSPDGASIAFETNRNGPSEVWISNFDGTNPRTVVASIPPFYEYGDDTRVDGLSWSPDGKWIAMSTRPVLGAATEDARLFIVPASGGGVRELVNECSETGDGPTWSPDSRFIYVRESLDAWSRAAIATGELTPVQVINLPKSAREILGSKSWVEQPHIVDGGRYLYYVESANGHSDLVTIGDFVK